MYFFGEGIWVREIGIESLGVFLVLIYSGINWKFIMKFKMVEENFDILLGLV